MKLWVLVALVACLGLIVPGASSADSTWTPDQKQAAEKVIVKKSRTVSESCPGHVAGLTFYRSRYIHHSLKMGPVRVDFTRPKNCVRAVYLANRWEKRAYKMRVQLEQWQARQQQLQVLRERRQLYEKWRCIHEHEGAWNANTGNGYYGGLQMDYGFQSAYGSEFIARWGTADRWPVWVQITAAERSYHGYGGYGGRGFGPWPNTSRMCGLR